MVRKRKFTSAELRTDIAVLSDEIQQSQLLVSALVRSLRYLYPEKYKDLLSIEVIQCVKRDTRIRYHRDYKITGRTYIKVKPKPIITRHVKPKKGIKPPDIIKCRHCGRFIEKSEEWVISGIEVGVYICPHCETKNEWRADKQVKEKRKYTID